MPPRPGTTSIAPSTIRQGAGAEESALDRHASRERPSKSTIASAGGGTTAAPPGCTTVGLGRSRAWIFHSGACAASAAGASRISSGSERGTARLLGTLWALPDRSVLRFLLEQGEQRAVAGRFHFLRRNEAERRGVHAIA